MRKVFCASLVDVARDPQFVFLTGDLGFMALEDLRAAMGPRFINAGIAEQNMVSLCAGMARLGLRPWAYSIAPFIYARPFEQIRNDLCLHRLPVVLVGNGGGYGYGVQGATHHAIEDYGALLCLQGMTVHIPAFDGDVPLIIRRLLHHAAGPTYLRLGLSEQPKGIQVPPYAQWRKLLHGDAPATIIAVGPLVGGLLQALPSLPRQPRLWLLSELPALDLPAELLHDLRSSRHLLIAEEHVARGSAGEMLAHRLLSLGVPVPKFTHRHALGYPSGLYGSQAFHRQESGLDPVSLLQTLHEEVS